MRDIANDTRPYVFEKLSARSIYEDRGPVNWICPDLQIGPGKVTAIVGPPNGGKTMMAQRFALDAITKRPAWGRFPIDRAVKVLHVDADQGARSLMDRYAALALGAGIEEREYVDALDIVSYPTLLLNTPNAEAYLESELRGYDLAIFDSLRTMTPGDNENDSAMGDRVQMLGRISERIGVVNVLLHHTGKNQEPRGSNAIFGASGNFFHLSEAKHDARRVRQERAPGLPMDDFSILIRPVEGDGIDVRAVDGVEPQRPERDHQRDVALVLEAVRKTPGTSANQVRQNVPLGDEKVRSILKELHANGQIVVQGPPTKPSYYLPSA